MICFQIMTIHSKNQLFLLYYIYQSCISKNVSKYIKKTLICVDLDYLKNDFETLFR